MKIVLIGYGKMGRTIERLAIDQGHEISGRIDMETDLDQRLSIIRDGDVAIEFSHPLAALSNITEALQEKIPVVSGTTGWLDKRSKIEGLIDQTNGSFFYASNFSIGVNLFFAINKKLASLMNGYDQYDIKVDETHHIHKKDAPSGTAITMVEGILEHVERKDKWSLQSSEENVIQIEAHRRGEVYGDHKVRYISNIDTIELSHSAHTREGFALGAIMAAKWLYNEGNPHKGWNTMEKMMAL